ncbi:MAG: winged helix-turn-helix transcriptional regulator [Tissierellia bacterium]|nr:winged helix-turn-helix transcriptional regulator [Tissierellia bacterium]
MRFRFSLTGSRIYDFIHFPRLLYYTQEYESSKEWQNYEELVMDDYLDLVKKVEDRLKPFSKEIEIFYMKDLFSGYDFIDLISRATGLLGYEREEEYLDVLLTLDEQEIRRNIILSILIQNENSFSEETRTRADEIIKDRDVMISFIKELPTEAGIKWNLFLFIDEPLKYTKIYVGLMTKLLPIFKDIYLPYEEEVKKYGEELVSFLNKKGAEGLREISYSILDASILDNKEVYTILISVFFSYTVSMAVTMEDKYIAWGIEMEEAFKKMKEINDNKINERVQVFKNLGDRTRYEVLKLIASGETSTKEIANRLGVTSATVSYHINNFLTSKVIKLDKSNTRFGYVVDYDLLNEIIEGLKEDLQFPT